MVKLSATGSIETTEEESSRFFSRLWEMLVSCFMKKKVQRENFEKRLNSEIKVGDNTYLNVLFDDDFLEFVESPYWSKKKIAVVNAETSFCLEVEEPDGEKKPPISPVTLHGQWILKMQKLCGGKKEFEDEFKERLNKALSSSQKSCKKFKEDKSDKKNKLKIYEVGSIVPFDRPGTLYLILAFSTLDPDTYKAKATVEDLKTCLKKIICFCDNRGQGRDVYLPLMGLGLSRVDWSTPGSEPQSAFNLFKEVFDECKKSVHSKYTIVAPAKYKAQLGFV